MKGSVVRPLWKIERVFLTPVDKFAAFGPRVFNSVAAILMVAVIAFATYTGLTTPAPTKAHPALTFIRNWQQAAGITGAVLWIVMVALTLFAYGDVHRAQNDEQKRVAWHYFRMALYRLIAKTLIAGLLVEIWFQRYHDIITWIMKHPLAQFELIFAAAATLTLLGIVEMLWYRWWVQQPPIEPPTERLKRSST